MQIRVFYEDTDAGGVVYHSNYLNFCERARSNLFFKKGLSPHNENEFFVVKNLEADYIKPAKLGDILEVSVEVLEIKSASAIIYQEIKKEEELLFKATIKVAFLKNYKPSKIPTKLIEILKD